MGIDVYNLNIAIREMSFYYGMMMVLESFRESISK